MFNPIKKIKEAREARIEEAIHEAGLLIEMMKSPGWRVIKRFIEEIANPGRLVISYEDSIKANDPDMRKALFVSGQVRGMEELRDRINKAIQYGEAGVKEKQRKENVHE